MRHSAMASRESSSPARSNLTSQVVDAEAPPRPDPDFHQGLAVQAVCGAIERAAAERHWVKLEGIVTPWRRRVWPGERRDLSQTVRLCGTRCDRHREESQTQGGQESLYRPAYRLIVSPAASGRGSRPARR